MYYEHYGLKAPPFRITPDTSLFYSGGNRGAILDAMVYAITSGEGITKVVGEVGSGKTMLCRMLEVRLPASVEVVYLANPSLAPEDTLHAIAFEMKLPVSRSDNRLQVMQALQDYLVRKHAENKQVVVFVEEAQSMPLGTLEEIRLLSNLETQHYKLLQIVMFGQPELEENLSAPNIRQLRERITHSFNLEPFNRGEIGEYVNYRLHAAGYRGPEVFSSKALKAIEKYSAGLTRRVNILADKALLAAYAGGEHSVAEKHVRIAAADSDFGYASQSHAYWPYVAAAGLAAAVLGAVLWFAGAAVFEARGAADQMAMAGGAAQAAVATPDLPIDVNALAATAAGGIITHSRPEHSPQLIPGAGDAAAPLEPAASVAHAGRQGNIQMPAPARPAPNAESALAVTRAVSAPPAAVRSMQEAADIAGETDPVPAATVTGAEPATAQPGTVTAALKVAENSGPASRPVAAPESGPRQPRQGIARDIQSAAVSMPVRHSADYLQARMQETSRWLAEADGDHYSIQLMMIRKDRGHSLGLNLSAAGFANELDRVYVYETSVNGNEVLSVLLDEFPTVYDANTALASLPDSVRSGGPFVRNIRDIRVVRR